MTRPRLNPADLFRLEIPAAPAVSRSGAIAYLRQRSDAMADAAVAELWTLDPDGSGHRRLAPGEPHVLSFAWSVCGSKIAYVAREPPPDAAAQTPYRLMVVDVASGSELRIATVACEPRMLAWAPDGQRIAFVMAVKHSPPALVQMPTPPPGANWAPRARYIDQSNYRLEGVGLIEHSDGLFIV